MAPDRVRLDEAVQAVADGEAVDWEGLESSVGEEDRAAVHHLRLVARVAEVHRSVQTPGPRSSPVPAAAPAAPESSSHATWGPLILFERIGGGVYGDVYRARDPRLDRDVALKLLRAAPCAEEGSGQEVIGEARLLARIRHPHVVTVYGADRFDGRVGLWMELVRGRSLDREVLERGPLGAHEAAVIGLDVCAGLAAVHQAGLVHRDVKAGNVMREDAGRIVLMDFGTGCALVDPDESGATGLAGTPLYAAPEVLAGQPATPSSDLYGLGVLLYFLVTGAYPVFETTIDGLRDAHRRSARRPLRDARPDLPGAFIAVVERALEPDSRNRFPSAGAMEAALAGVLVPRAVDIGSMPAPEPARSERPRARRAVFTRIVPRTWRGRVAVLAASAVLVAGSLVAYRNWPRTGEAGAALGFQSRDWVLITAFDNRTGDPKLDGTVEYALERELGNSHFVNIVPRERVGDALGLMRKPLNTRLDEAIGREVCLRDGGIRAMVAGRVEKLGSVVDVSVRLVDPNSGRTLLAAAVEVTEEAQILRAVRDLSNQVRAGLGEARREIATTDQALEKATTPSLKALQLYSQAMTLLSFGGAFSDWKTAGILLKQAIAYDPEFASAHIYLSWTMQLDPSQSGRAAMLATSERARQLADHATERERLFIEGSYYMQRQEFAKAVVPFEALVRIYPDHFWGVSNLAIVHGFLRNREAALNDLTRRAELRPKNLALYVALAQAHLEAGHAAETGRFAAHARELGAAAPVPTASAVAPALAWAECFPIWEQWARADTEGAMTAVRQLLAEADRHTAPVALRRRLSRWLTVLGRLRESESLLASRWEELRLQEIGMWARLAWHELLRGNRAAARRLMVQWCRNTPVERWYYHTGLLLARTGLTREARSIMTRNARPPELEWGGYPELLRGEIALADGRIAEATTLLEQSLERLSGVDAFRWFAVQSLSTALEARGDRTAALAVLERAEPRLDRQTEWGEVWLDLQARRARLLRQLGRPAEAELIEGQLRQYLAYADPDLVIVKQLAKLAR